MNLQRVDAYNSAIQSLDFTGVTTLQEIVAYNSALQSIALPDNPNLEIIRVSTNPLSNLDLSNCPGLKELYFTDCSFTSIDLSGNPQLEHLSGARNQLTSVDITNNPNLKEVILFDNLIGPSVDLSNNSTLLNLNLSGNPIVNLDLSNNNDLIYLKCQKTNLVEVDMSGNPNIEYADFFQCSNLQLINIKNGTNATVLEYLLATFCSNLSCVVVDDASAENDNISINGQTVLVDDESQCVFGIEGINLDIMLTIYPNPTSNLLTIQNQNGFEINSITLYDTLGRKVLESNEATEAIDVSNLTAGIYFLHITTDSGMVTKKVIKE